MFSMSEKTKQVAIMSAAFAFVAAHLKLHKQLGMQKQIAIPVISALAVKAAIGDLDQGWSMSQSDMEFWAVSLGSAWLTSQYLAA